MSRWSDTYWLWDFDDNGDDDDGDDDDDDDDTDDDEYENTLWHY